MRSVWALSTVASHQNLTWEVGKGTKLFPRPRRANFVAFQSLLQKWRYPRILLTSRLMSRPRGGASVTPPCSSSQRGPLQPQVEESMGLGEDTQATEEEWRPHIPWDV